MKKEIELFTDGACSGNPGPGGWGAILRYGGKEKELSGAMGIQSLPTIVFIPKSGQPQVIIGAVDKATFRRAIDEVLLNKK